VLRAAVPPIMRPLRHRGFAFLWAASTLAVIGGAGASIATAWQILTMQGSAVDLGLLVALLTAANLVTLPLGGIVADRFPRERILLVAALLSAFSSIGISALIRFDLLQIWHLYALAVFFGVLASLRAPASQAIRPTLLPKDDLLKGNALIASSAHLVGMVGAALGGILVDLWGTSGAFAFQGALGAVSALCLLGVRPSFATEPASDQPRGSWLRPVGEGIAAVRRIPWVWGTIVLFAVGNAFAAASLNVAIPVRIRQELHLDATVLGTMNSAGAAGALVAALVLGQARSVRQGGVVAFCGIILGGLALAAAGLQTTTFGLLAAAFFGWGGMAVFVLIWNSTLQRKIPANLLGRVSSVDSFGSLILVPVGVPLLSILVHRMGATDVLLGSGLAVVALALLALALPTVRRWD